MDGGNLGSSIVLLLTSHAYKTRFSKIDGKFVHLHREPKFWRLIKKDGSYIDKTVQKTGTDMKPVIAKKGSSKTHFETTIW